MATLKEEAQAYEPPQTLNIADLERVDITALELKDGIAKEGTKEEFRYKYIEIEGKQYRVPGAVLGSIKTLVKEIPDLKYVKVLKSGEGLKTTYQVIQKNN